MLNTNKQPVEPLSRAAKGTFPQVYTMMLLCYASQWSDVTMRIHIFYKNE